MFVDTQVRPQGEQVDAVAPAKMKLSEAIRIGARLRGECRGVWRYARYGTGCALVAACEATGLPYDQASYSEPIFKHLSRLYPELEDKIHAIPTLMDRMRYSREQIISWLESQGL